MQSPRPAEVAALDGALAKIVHTSYGSLALRIVSAGLIALPYSFTDTRYRI